MNFTNISGYTLRWKVLAALFGALIVVSLALTIPLILDDQAGMALRSGREIQLTSIADEGPLVSVDAIQLRARQNHGWQSYRQAPTEPKVSASAIQLRARSLHSETLNTIDPSTMVIGRFVSE